MGHRGLRVNMNCPRAIIKPWALFDIRPWTVLTYYLLAIPNFPRYSKYVCIGSNRQNVS